MKIILHFIGIISSFTQQTIRSGTDLYLSPISDVSRYSASPGGTRRSGAGNEVAPVQKLPATERDIQNFRYREIILQGKATTAPSWRNRSPRRNRTICGLLSKQSRKSIQPMRPRISERWAPRYWLETRSPGSGPPGLKGYLHLGDFVFDFQFLFLEIRDQSFVGMGVVHFLVDPFFQFCMPRLESIFPVFSVHRSLHLSLIRQNRIPAIERLQNISCQPTANSSISA